MLHQIGMQTPKLLHWAMECVSHILKPTTTTFWASHTLMF